MGDEPRVFCPKHAAGSNKAVSTKAVEDAIALQSLHGGDKRETGQTERWVTEPVKLLTLEGRPAQVMSLGGFSRVLDPRDNDRLASFVPFKQSGMTKTVMLVLLAACLGAFCCGEAQAQAQPKLEGSPISGEAFSLRSQMIAYTRKAFVIVI